MATQIQIRRDTSANWTSANPTLAQGEQGFETDTNKLKIGDGTSDWNTLDYLVTGDGGGGGGGATVTIVTSLPASGTEVGQLVFHAGLGIAYFWNGANWIPMGNAQEVGITPSVAATLEPDFGAGGEMAEDLFARLRGDGWTIMQNVSPNSGASNSYSRHWIDDPRDDPSSYYSWADTASSFDSTKIMAQSGTYTLKRDPVDGFVISDQSYPYCVFNTTTSDIDNAQAYWASISEDLSDYEGRTYYGYGGKTVDACTAQLSGESASNTYAYQLQYRGALLMEAPSTPVTDWADQPWRLTLEYIAQGWQGDLYANFQLGMWLSSSTADWPEGNWPGRYDLPMGTSIFFGLCSHWSGASYSSFQSAPARPGIIMNSHSKNWAINGGRGTQSNDYIMGSFGYSNASNIMLGMGTSAQNITTSSTSNTSWWDSITNRNPNLTATTKTPVFGCTTTIEWDPATKVMTYREKVDPGFNVEGEKGTNGTTVVTTSDPLLGDELYTALKAMKALPKFLYMTNPGRYGHLTDPGRRTGYHLAPIKLERLA